MKDKTVLDEIWLNWNKYLMIFNHFLFWPLINLQKNVTFYYKMLHFLLFIITIILLLILDIPGKSLSCGMCLIIFSTAKEYSMGTTQPIRNKDELAAFRMYYKDIHPNRRNYCLIVMGLNTALRISDLLKLKWDNVYNFEHHVFRSHFLINEQKTGKDVTLN